MFHCFSFYIHVSVSQLKIKFTFLNKTNVSGNTKVSFPFQFHQIFRFVSFKNIIISDMSKLTKAKLLTIEFGIYYLKYCDHKNPSRFKHHAFFRRRIVYAVVSFTLKCFEISNLKTLSDFSRSCKLCRCTLQSSAAVQAKRFSWLVVKLSNNLCDEK